MLKIMQVMDLSFWLLILMLVSLVIAYLILQAINYDEPDTRDKEDNGEWS